MTASRAALPAPGPDRTPVVAPLETSRSNIPSLDTLARRLFVVNIVQLVLLLCLKNHIKAAYVINLFCKSSCKGMSLHRGEYHKNRTLELKSQLLNVKDGFLGAPWLCLLLHRTLFPHCTRYHRVKRYSYNVLYCHITPKLIWESNRLSSHSVVRVIYCSLAVSSGFIGLATGIVRPSSNRCRGDLNRPRWIWYLHWTLKIIQDWNKLLNLHQK